MKKEKTTIVVAGRDHRCDRSHAGILWKSGKYGILYCLLPP